jgi:uncharacterized membrane protein YqaE (UPF0057 family)
MPEQPHMRQFLLYVFVLMVPCFVVWTAVGGSLATPAIGLVNQCLTNWFPTVVDALYLDGTNALLMTRFGENNGEAVPLAGADYQLGFRINPMIVTVSVPFYTVLHFATPRTTYLGSYLYGLTILYLLMIFGLLCLCLKELMVNLGGTFFEQPDVFVPNANIIGILYQFNVLIVPTLAPAIIWIWQGRNTPLLRSSLGVIANNAAQDNKSGSPLLRKQSSD